MLLPDENIFPANVVKYTSLAMGSIDPDIRIFRRTLRNTDPAQSIGVSAMQWGPDNESLEIQALGSPGIQMPTIQKYILNVQAFVKDSEEERGLSIHAHMSQRVRSVLYTNPNLQVVLSEMSADLTNGWTESMRRWGVQTVRYFSGEINSQMLYLSTLEFWVETETRRTQ